MLQDEGTLGGHRRREGGQVERRDAGRRGEMVMTPQSSADSLRIDATSPRTTVAAELPTGRIILIVELDRRRHAP